MARLKGKDEEITGKLDPKYLVQKSDPLVLMRSVPFSLGELKILDTYISRINAADDTRRTVVFTKEEYEELMGLTSANYRALAKHTEGLLGKVVTLEMPDKSFLKFVLFTKAYYHKDKYGKPIIEITCTEEARDLFFCIGKYHYFSYALENVIKLTHKSSYLLYVYIRHNRFRGEWDIDLDELRDTVLDCKGQESYQAFKEFKRAVLDPAVKEVNKKTDCHFDYEAIKRGRRVAQIKFVYVSNEQLEGQLTFDQLINNAPLLTDHNENEEKKLVKVYGSKHLATLAKGCRYEFDKEQMEHIYQLVKRFPDTQIQDYLLKMYSKFAVYCKQKKVKDDNRYTYFCRMLENDRSKPKEKSSSYDLDEYEAFALNFGLDKKND